MLVELYLLPVGLFLLLIVVIPVADKTVPVASVNIPAAGLDVPVNDRVILVAVDPCYRVTSWQKWVYLRPSPSCCWQCYSSSWQTSHSASGDTYSCRWKSFYLDIAGRTETVASKDISTAGRHGTVADIVIPEVAKVGLLLEEIFLLLVEV